MGPLTPRLGTPALLIKRSYSSYQIQSYHCPAGQSILDIPWTLEPETYPASAQISAKSKAERRVFVAGFRTTVFPIAKAGHTFHANNITGKFHGTIAPTTPGERGRENILPERNIVACTARKIFIYLLFFLMNERSKVMDKLKKYHIKGVAVVFPNR